MCPPGQTRIGIHTETREREFTMRQTGTFKNLSIQLVTVLTAVTSLLAPTKICQAEDFRVYSIYKALDLGIAGETPQKDYYVNMGTAQGLRVGSVLEVQRKTPTYDLSNQKLYKDVSFPIARLKVIHAESNASIARLEKMLPADKTPVISPNAVMVGDFVNRAN